MKAELCSSACLVPCAQCIEQSEGIWFHSWKHVIRGSVEENIGSGGERKGTKSEEGAEEVCGREKWGANKLASFFTYSNKSRGGGAGIKLVHSGEHI